MGPRAERVPDLRLERRARGLVCGIDEAGRGPWAGPVVAAAVILGDVFFQDRPRRAPELAALLRDGLDDSKRLSPERREALAAALVAAVRAGLVRFGIAAASASEIDRLNVLAATELAMARALAALGVAPRLAIVDGNRAPPLPCPVETIVGGDGLSLTIAAASILAKVTRDRLMVRLAARHPGYGWEHNKGYGTAAHRQALFRLGPTPHHRRTFAPVRVVQGTLTL